MQLLTFTFDGQIYALEISKVTRVLRAVEITRLPKAPGIVLGVINVQGELIPVVNLRKRFGLPDRSLSVDDRLIVVQTAHRAVALVADTVTEVTDRSEAEIISPESIFPGLEAVRGVVRLADGMMFIYDLNACLSLEEEAQVENAIHAAL